MQEQKCAYLPQSFHDIFKNDASKINIVYIARFMCGQKIGIGWVSGEGMKPDDMDGYKFVDLKESYMYIINTLRRIEYNVACMCLMVGSGGDMI